ncbi:MAG: TraR/DksA C4-type zinc finger protein [Solirubrobacterales bacterium]
MLDELDGRIGELTKTPERGSTVQFGRRIGDGTTEAVSRFTDVAIVDNLIGTRERVSRALEKIDDGSYGRCDACGAKIPAGRLQAAPESTLCMACAAGRGTGERH